MAKKKNNIILFVGLGVLGYLLYKNYFAKPATRNTTSSGQPKANLPVTVFTLTTTNTPGVLMDAEGYLYRDNYDGTYTDQQGNIVNSQGDIIKSADPFSGNIPNPLIAPLAIPISQVVPSTGVNPDTTVQAKTINPLFVNQENPGPSNVGPVNTPIVQSSMPIYNTPVKVLTLPDGTTQSLALLTGANRKLGRVPVVF